MWTRKDINEFKETISREEGDAIIKVKIVNSGENIFFRLMRINVFSLNIRNPCRIFEEN